MGPREGVWGRGGLCEAVTGNWGSWSYCVPRDVGSVGLSLGIGCHWVCVDHKKGLEALRILWFYDVL